MNTFATDSSSFLFLPAKILSESRTTPPALSLVTPVYSRRKLLPFRLLVTFV